MENKHYLGDYKDVLYQYICNMNSKNANIRCGNFVFDKLKSASIQNNNNTNNTFYISINGEAVFVINVPKLDKKQLIISNHEIQPFCELPIEIFPGDIDLYFI
jgi:hypothetical protein